MNDERPDKRDLSAEVDAALRSFWRGSSAEFDRLLADDDGGPWPCSLLLALLEHEAGNARRPPPEIGD
jgi:hypothetical protein